MNSPLPLNGSGSVPPVVLPSPSLYPPLGSAPSALVGWVVVLSVVLG